MYSLHYWTQHFIFDTFTVILVVEYNERKAHEYVTRQLYLQEIIQLYSSLYMLRVHFTYYLCLYIMAHLKLQVTSEIDRIAEYMAQSPLERSGGQAITTFNGSQMYKIVGICILTITWTGNNMFSKYFQNWVLLIL